MAARFARRQRGGGGGGVCGSREGVGGSTPHPHPLLAMPDYTVNFGR